MELTFFEIHLDGSTFNAPFTGDDESADGDEVDESSGIAVAEGESGGGLRPLLAVAVLLGLALLARYLRSDEGEADADEGEAPVEGITFGGD
jgi:hypothetical protein